MNFLYPPNPSPIYSPKEFFWDSSDWIVQIKKNGCRAIVVGEEGEVTIYNRLGSILSVSKEFNWDCLLDLFKPPFMLDGELIGRKQGEWSNRLYLWDILAENGESYIKRTYGFRLRILCSQFATPRVEVVVSNDFTADRKIIYSNIGEKGGVEISIANSFPASEWERLLIHRSSDVRKGENEGLVFKSLDANYKWTSKRQGQNPGMFKFLWKYWEERKKFIVCELGDKKVVIDESTGKIL